MPPGENGARQIDPARPAVELLSALAEAIALVRSFLEERGVSLDDVIHKTGFGRNAAILACKEAINENDETRKRFELLCREVFKKFKACITINAVNEHRRNHSAINIIYKSLQQDRVKADIGDIIRKLQQVVDTAIDLKQPRLPAASTEGADQPGRTRLHGRAGTESAENPQEPYDISTINFQALREEFKRSEEKRTTVQSLKAAIEQRLHFLIQQNPLRGDLQQRYEKIIDEYNREKDRPTIEQSFDALLQFCGEVSEEEGRAMREGLDEESLALFDLLRKLEHSPVEIGRIKKVAKGLLETLKAEKLKVLHWRDRESSRDAVLLEIRHYLLSDDTGLPPDSYTDEEVEALSAQVYRHIFRAYPGIPSPYYEVAQSA